MDVELAKYNSQYCKWTFPESEDTQKGHMKQQRQGVWSTKPKNVQADQLQYYNVEINIIPATHSNKTYFIVRFVTRKKQSTLTRLENSLCN